MAKQPRIAILRRLLDLIGLLAAPRLSGVGAPGGMINTSTTPQP